MRSLVETITSVAAKAKKYGDRSLGEQNTKASLIEPVLEALGWDIRDPDEVHREFRPTGRDSPVDYALKLMRKPRLFLEAKGLGETLSDRRWIAQVLGYATVAGVEWCVLTDGDEYRFYNATAPVDADEKMFWRVRLTESAENETERALCLMSRPNLEQNLLDALWVSHFIDRRVKTALCELLSTPANTIVRAVRHGVANVTAKEVAESIRRLDIQVQVPAVLPEPSRPKPVRTASPRQSRAPRKPRSNNPVSISDLIEARLVTPPLGLFRRYKGRNVEATILPNGDVSFDGTSYKTCSAAAEAARASVTGRKMNTNGWTFWQYEEAGKLKPLDVLRQQLVRPREETGKQPPLRLAGR